MTEGEYSQYNTLVRDSYMKYMLKLQKKATVQTINVQEELDHNLWLLGKAISVVLSFTLDGYNKFTRQEMLQWQDVMNDLMKTRIYVDFIIE